MASYTGKIDLHMHTTVSDGTDTPEEILQRVKEAEIGVFAITDHDAVKGCKALRGVLTAADPRFVSGAEFSCRDELGKYHILGYGFDPDAEAVQDVVRLGHSYRMNKVRARLDYLAREFGFRFSAESLDRLFALDNPGKPHIANMMVEYGFAPTKEEAIKQYINGIHFRNEYVRPEEAIAGILGGGGIPVLAHPVYGDGDQLILGEEMEARLKRLIGFGLQGLETFYSGFTDRLRGQVLALAERYGLYVTAGSDYHGKNKLVVLGDTGYDPGREMPEGMRRFLEALGI